MHEVLVLGRFVLGMRSTIELQLLEDCPQTPYQGLPFPRLNFVPMTPVVDPLDAKPGATRVHNACVVHN